MKHQGEGGSRTIGIKRINHGVAYYVIDKYTSYIEVNKDLFANPKLLAEVLKHEIEHSKAKNIWQQYWIDWKDSWNLPKQLKLAIWQMQHPESFTNMLPVLFSRKKVSVNWYMVIFWLLCGICLILFVRMFWIEIKNVYGG